MTFVRIPESQAAFADQFWPEVDETILSVDLRRRLAANGFRCGLLGSPVPTALQEVLDQVPETDPQQGTKVIDPGRQVVARTSRMRSCTGETGKILVRSTPVEKMAALAFDDDGHVHGESLEKAQFLFALTSFAQGDGGVELDLIPMIEHGDPKSRFRGENGAWIVDNTSRDVLLYDDMKINSMLNPGEALAITCTGRPRGLGEQFFGDDGAEKIPRLLLVVRLQQTQRDSRFESRDSSEPIASVLD